MCARVRAWCVCVCAFHVRTRKRTEKVKRKTRPKHHALFGFAAQARTDPGLLKLVLGLCASMIYTMRDAVKGTKALAAHPKPEHSAGAMAFWRVATREFARARACWLHAST